MRSSLPIACLALLTACGPKITSTDVPSPAGPPPPSSDSEAPTTEGDATGTSGSDGGSFQWTDEFSSLELLDGLAGQELQRREDGRWETRARPSWGRGAVGRGGSVHVLAAPRSAASSEALEFEGMGELDGGSGGLAVGRSLGTVGGGSGGDIAFGGKAKTGELAMRSAAPQPALKAGTTDDNANFDAWLTYVSEWGGRGDIAGWADRLDVTGRRYVQVLDAKGRPVPDARVSILDPTSERVVWAGRGYGDGRVPMYPKLKVPGRALDIAGDTPEGGWLVQAATPDGAVRTVRWDGRSNELDVTVDTGGLTRGAPVPVDVCFIIDTTGSMGDEIDRIKTTLLSVTDKLRKDASQGVDLRYGAVLYRDIGDEYVTRRHAFTADIEGFDTALQTIYARGGGDAPESLNQGIAVGVAGMEWREGAARVAFVIADAPPHMNYQEDVSYGRAAAAAAHRGIRIHTVAASGLNDRGSYAFRQIAQLTRGQFIYIEYGSSAASAADHGVRTPTASNNLDGILYGRIRAEIDGWGKDGTEKVALK